VDLKKVECVGKNDCKHVEHCNIICVRAFIKHYCYIRLINGPSSRGRCQGLLKIFRVPIHRAHRAVIFAIAQLSCTYVPPCTCLRQRTLNEACTCSDVLTIGFYRAMHFSAKRGFAIACRPSVRPSVRLSVCDVGGSGPHRLEILETNCTIN